MHVGRSFRCRLDGQYRHVVRTNGSKIHHEDKTSHFIITEAEVKYERI